MPGFFKIDLIIISSFDDLKMKTFEFEKNKGGLFSDLSGYFGMVCLKKSDLKR
jgi:hypothetical protein